VLHDQNSKLRKLKMADCRRFEKYCVLYISTMNYPTVIKFDMQSPILISRMVMWRKLLKFPNPRWRTDAILKSFVGYISVP